MIAYWGYETQPSVANAFYTERHIQRMASGVSTSNIQDPSGTVSQAGYEAWVKETDRKINSYLTKPSFDNKSFTMKKGETLRIDDTNSSLWAYNVASNTTNMNVSIDGNTLVVKAIGDVKDGRISLRYNVPSSYKGATLIYRHPYSQELLHASLNDPNYTVADIKVQKEGKLLLKKVDDTGKAVEGAEFTLNAEGKTTTGKTNAKGELITPNYNVGTVVDFEETKAPAGHYIDPATSKGSVTIKEGTNEIKVTNPRYANLTLIKKNDKGQNLEGTTFKLSYLDKVETLKSNKDGQLFVKGLKAGTKVEWEEIATIKGHYIDPKTSKGSIVVKSGENTINVNNPTLNFGMTSQASNQDGAQFVNPTKGQKLRDEVMIQANQAPANAKLRLTTDLVEFGTGKELGEKSFKQVNEFEAKQAQFVKNVYVDFDATGMHGKKAVFTNVLEYYNPSTKEWEEVARHDDVNNEAESIQFVSPEIHTEAFVFDQNNTESKLTDPLKKVKGYDRVYYKNLIAGQTYTFDLTMMNRETGKEFLDPNGKKVTGTITVVAGKDGKVTSTINAKEYYENLAKEEAEKDTESDKEETTESTDDAQAKAVKATAESEESKDNEAKEETEDATEFSTLSEVELLEGYVDVPFEADLSDAKGNILVAYEQLSTNDTPVADHKDIEDKKQTIKVRNPEISTTAFVDGKKEVTKDGKIVFEDVVEYKNLTPGVEYEMSMTVMVKDEQAPLELQNKVVSGTTKFTPEKETGTTTVKVEFDAKELFSKYGDKVDLVAFEETKSNDEVIAEHKDINDKGQTVTVKKPVVPVSTKTTRTIPQTSGTLGNPLLWAAVVFVIVASALYIYLSQKKKD